MSRRDLIGGSFAAALSASLKIRKQPACSRHLFWAHKTDACALLVLELLFQWRIIAATPGLRRGPMTITSTRRRTIREGFIISRIRISVSIALKEAIRCA